MNGFTQGVPSALPYDKVESFKVGDQLFDDERKALISALACAASINPADAENVVDSASALVPLIARAVELNSSAAATQLGARRGGAVVWVDSE